MEALSSTERFLTQCQALYLRHHATSAPKRLSHFINLNQAKLSQKSI